jgi:hypothetical protein
MQLPAQIRMDMPQVICTSDAGYQSAVTRLYAAPGER